MKISKEFDAIVGFAREEAMRTGSFSIEADHLFLGILRHGSNSAVEAMRVSGIDTADCKREIDTLIFHDMGIPYGREDDVRLGREGSNTVSLAIAEAIADGAEETGAIHLLKAICKQDKSHSSEYLRRRGLNSSSFSLRKIDGQKQEQPSLSRKEIAILLSTINLNTNKTIVS
ncbi:MAG: hypothetical protein IKZ60_07220 [Bacteroidales bacterium]|nr:hypothetical protein [Bacteroidales bacterium]